MADDKQHGAVGGAEECAANDGVRCIYVTSKHTRHSIVKEHIL